MLKCSGRGLDIHEARQPASAVIARLQCGESVLVVDQRFGSAHVRNEAGKDGYIIEMNLGQFSFEPEPGARLAPVGTIAGAPAPITFQPRPITQDIVRDKDEVRQFEIQWTPSWLRLAGVNMAGSNLTFTTNITNHIGIMGDIGGYAYVHNSDSRVFTYRAGPAFTFRSRHVSGTGYALAGGAEIQDTGYLLFVGPTVVKYRTSQSAAAGGIGGRLDVSLRRWLSLRAIDAEWMPMYADGGWLLDSVRVGAGLSFRFGDR